MQKSQLIHVFIIYITFSNINQVLLYRSLVVLKDSPSSSRVYLPAQATESDGRIIYPEIEDDKKSYSYLCPEIPDPEKYLEDSSRMFPEDAYCLMDSASPPCWDEIQPLFTKSEEGAKCDDISNNEFYRMGFNYCRFTKFNGNKRPIMSYILSLYDVCFDPSDSKTLWTRHNVLTPFMLQGEGLQSQQMEADEETLNEDSFTLPNKKAFSNVAQIYKNQPSDSPYRMIPQLLVPKEDMALKIWRKTTTHYLNTAALWYKLAPLMKAINNGIRKIAITAQLTNGTDKFDIYTAVRSTLSPFRQLVNKLQNFIFQNQLNDSNIWCKFIYRPSFNKGIMIFLHNLPDNPPVDVYAKSKQSDSKRISKECDKPVPCDFRKWSNQAEDLSNELLEYAYCCKVDSVYVKKLFNVELKSDLELLDIDNVMITPQ